ncbi:dihydroxy-acid dehydratase [Asticcacaulis sp. BYS171W]|uniref:Dihydroxy-acid dehydratase n=1 Tax=Asticcacaulis aquaticus TaxID=2984212 RepID=A0ABT5HTE1_9CAUL|nr:dihydroxy-acid dehydratase [Asticcacaulis aquaticus]MDC7683299.1 dihydroxy-acid dehydratase [Asticcacaulis aquaticus]
MNAQTRIIDPAAFSSSNFVILHGSLSPEGCVMTGGGFERDPHEARTRVFAVEADAIAAIEEGRVANGEAIVIAAADDAEMSAIFAAIDTAGLRDIALISNGRFAPSSNGIVIGHVGKAIRYVQNFDTLTIDIKNRRIDIDADIVARRNDAPRETKVKNGFAPMGKYAAIMAAAEAQ